MDEHDQPVSCNPIRVMHVASGDLWAGAEVQLYTLAGQLHGMSGVEVLVVLLNRGELESRLRNAGVKVEVIDERAMPALSIARQLRTLMMQHSSQVIHTHRTKEHILATIANLTSINVPMLRTQHGAPEHALAWYDLRRQLIRALDELTVRLGKVKIIAVSEALGRQLRRKFGEERVSVIRNGIDVTKVRSEQKPSVSPAHKNVIRVGFIGRLEPVKRIDLFVEMTQRLIRKYPKQEWQFHVFGDGSQKTEAEDLARKLGTLKAVNFHGHVPNAASHLASLQALVICSDHEGTPMGLLEAIAVGLPVVAHDVGGVSDALRGIKSGELVLEHNPDAYASAVSRVALCAKDKAYIEPPPNWPYRASINALETVRDYLEVARS